MMEDDDFEQRPPIKIEESIDEAEPWLTSYADMMSLIACFFILLVGFANFDDPTFQRRAKAIGKYFKGSLTEDTGIEEEIQVSESKVKTVQEQPHTKDEKLVKKMQDLMTEVKEFSQVAGIAKILYKDGIEIVFNGNAMFDLGSAELKPDVKDAVDIMADLIKAKSDNFKIMVEGHTDNIPLKGGGIYPSNWELSAARSAAVVRRFALKGFPGEYLSAIGYADARPLVPNLNGLGRPIPENQAMNRRIVVKVLYPDTASREKLGLGVYFSEPAEEKSP